MRCLAASLYWCGLRPPPDTWGPWCSTHFWYVSCSRARTVEAAREMAPKAQERGALRGAATAAAAGSRTRTGGSALNAAACAEPAAGACAPPARIGPVRELAADLGPARRSGGSGSVGGGGRAASESEGGGGAEEGLQAAKSTSDEELARRLHQQLNGPASPTALTRQRKRKQPVFYTPEVCTEPGSDSVAALHCLIVTLVVSLWCAVHEPCLGTRPSSDRLLSAFLQFPCAVARSACCQVLH